LVSDDLPMWARELVITARVAHRATASAAADPHVMPVVFAYIDGAFYIAIDEKPKSGRRLLRLRNIEATGKAALVIDRYDEDWRRLAWVLARGPARLFGPEDAAHGPALVGLRAKYPQYGSMRLEQAEMIELRPERWTSWRGNGDG
jgi:PPOX class probable F420-dependent enzyme